jgi:hypothetical protein
MQCCHIHTYNLRLYPMLPAAFIPRGPYTDPWMGSLPVLVQWARQALSCQIFCNRSVYIPSSLRRKLHHFKPSRPICWRFPSNFCAVILFQRLPSHCYAQEAVPGRTLCNLDRPKPNSAPTYPSLCYWVHIHLFM